MKDLVEAILQQTSLQRRFLMWDIGGPNDLIMLRNFTNLVMHAKELEV
jgi:hypothetical protein